MKKGKFSKQAMLKYLDNRVSALEKYYGFTADLGFGQVLGDPQEKTKAYGEYRCLLKIIADIVGGYITKD